MNQFLPIKFLSKLSLLAIALSVSTFAIAKEVISPEKFSGDIAGSYKAAQKAKDVCSKLFCYCGCDLTDEHTSLLDCFTSMHGVDCSICQEEALIACHMKENGNTLAQIQKAIDERFAAQYPWDEASLAFENYFKKVKLAGTKTLSKTTVRTKDNTSIKNLQKNSRTNCCGH